MLAIGVPVYVRFSLGEVWLDGLPLFLRLVVTNPVVLAVVAAVGLNLAAMLIGGSGPEAGVSGAGGLED